MRLSYSYFIDMMGLFATILVMNFAIVNYTNAQEHGFTQENALLVNQFESAIAAEDMASVYSLGFKLADQFSASRQFESTTSTYNRIAKLAKKLNSDSLYYSAKHAESFIYLFTKQNEKCEALSLEFINGDNTKDIPITYIASAYYMLGFILNSKSKYDESNENLFKGLSIYESIKDTIRMSESLRLIGMNYQGKSQLKEAITHLVKAIEYLEEMDSYLVINMYHSVINIFLDQKNVYKAKEYLSRIENYSDQIPNEKQFHKLQLLKARILHLNNEFDKSKKLIESSLNYFTTNKIDQFKNICFRYLANENLEENNLSLAQQYVDSMLFYRKYIKTNKELFSFYLLQGKLSHKKALHAKALSFLDSAKNSINEFKDIRKMQQFHHVMYQIYKDKNEMDTALSHLEKYKTLNDSIYMLNQNMLVNEIEAKYYKKEQAKEIISLNKEQAISLRQLKQHRMSLQFSILGLIILGIIAFYIYKLNNTLKSKNSDLKIAHSEKDILLREIHHRVKNNLQVISSLLALQSKYIKDDNALSAIKQGQDRVYSMALIHQDLYQTNNLKGVDSKDYFEHLIDNLFDSYNINEDNIELKYNVDSIILDVDTMIPLGLVMNELVSNALKHAFKNQKVGKINVDLKRSEDCLTLKVSDNGKGLNDINDLDGQSFGYELIKAFARKLKADIKIDSQEGLSIELKIKNYTTAA